jgi:outer membrane autotransporter barrel domain protein
MKKKLLFTTALVAAFAATNAYAMEINTDTEITGEEQAIEPNEKLIVSGGKLVATDTHVYAEGVEVTGGTVILNDGASLKNDNWDESFKLSSGTIIMNGGGDGPSIGTNHSSEEESWEYRGGKFEMTGGNLIVNGSENYIEGGDVTISAGAVDIAEGATLQTAATLIPSGLSPEEGDDAMAGEVAVIKLTDEGTINLSGTLVSDVSGNGNLNVKSSSALVDGNVSGSNLTFEADHSLSKLVSGTIGDLASLNVNKGTLTYDAPTGKIGNLNVAGGLDIGTNTVNATNVDFKDNSSLALRVAATDNYGKINADKIGIGNETTIKITLDNGVVGSEGETFKFLNSGNIDGEFTNKIAENGRYDIVQNKDGSFNVTQKNTTASDVVAEAGGTASNAATAEAWETINNSSNVSAQAKAVSTAIYDLSQETSAAGKKAYVDALTAVAPEVAPMVQKTQTETANQVFGAVSTRLTGGSISTGSEGMSSGDSNPDAAVWVQGMFNKSKLDDTSKAKGFDADSNGVALGIEKFVNKDVKVGAGYAYTNTDIDGFMRSTDVDTHTAILYGEYKPSNWYVNGIATYGWSDYSEDKNVAGVGVKADYDVETFGLQAMTGYDMQVKGFGFTPEAGLRYVHIKQDAYKDSADQKVSGNDSDILTGVIGAKVSKNFELSNGMNIKPEARIAATYDLFNDDVNSVVTLANGSAYAVDGEALDRFGMEFGAGVTAEVNDNVELSFGYEGKFREDYQDHTGLLNAKYKF